jgi:hypothetical protein
VRQLLSSHRSSEYEQANINVAEINPAGIFTSSSSAFSCSYKPQNLPRAAQAVRPAALAPRSLHLNVNIDLQSEFLEMTTDERVTLLADFANLANIPNTDIRKARSELPSFSTVKWTEYAEKHNLPLNASYLVPPPFTTPQYRLPPSFHATMLENAWHWQDVYCEVGDWGGEDARLRLLEPVCQTVAICTY